MITDNITKISPICNNKKRREHILKISSILVAFSTLLGGCEVKGGEIEITPPPAVTSPATLSPTPFSTPTITPSPTLAPTLTPTEATPTLKYWMKLETATVTQGDIQNISVESYRLTDKDGNTKDITLFILTCDNELVDFFSSQILFIETPGSTHMETTGIMKEYKAERTGFKPLDDFIDENRSALESPDGKVREGNEFNGFAKGFTKENILNLSQIGYLYEMGVPEENQFIIPINTQTSLSNDIDDDMLVLSYYAHKLHIKL